MDRKTVLISGLVSLIISLAVVTTAGIGFYLLFSKSNQTIVIQEPKVSENSNTEPNVLEDLPTPTPQKLEIQPSDISSISFTTSYKWYLDENTDCEKRSKELLEQNRKTEKDKDFGCKRISMLFKPNGTALKRLTFTFYDETTKKDYQEIWTAKISKADFDRLAKFICDAPIFQNWKDGLQMNVANTSISVEHTKGNRQIMGNVESTNSVFLGLMKNFRQLDLILKSRWRKCVDKKDCQEIL